MSYTRIKYKQKPTKQQWPINLFTCTLAAAVPTLATSPSSHTCLLSVAQVYRKILHKRNIQKLIELWVRGGAGSRAGRSYTFIYRWVITGTLKKSIFLYLFIHSYIITTHWLRLWIPELNRYTKLQDLCQHLRVCHTSFTNCCCLVKMFC